MTAAEHFCEAIDTLAFALADIHDGHFESAARCSHSFWHHIDMAWHKARYSGRVQS